MKIGEVSKETGLSVSNIRFYERKGLLCPKRREESQYREYGPEDVRRLKEIMLLRKLGISVESIYLLYQGQAEYESLLTRQEKELQEQMEMLQGSLELCRLLEKGEPLKDLDVDRWLAYVHEEEEHGKRFAAAEELLEELAEFSGTASWRSDPYVGRFFQKPWAARVLALLLLSSVLYVCAAGLLGGIREAWGTAIGFWLLCLLGLLLDFCRFRRKHRTQGEED